MEAPTFLDYAFENQGGKRTIKFLEEMKKYIPYRGATQKMEFINQK